MSDVYQWALAMDQTRVFNAGVEAALSLNPLASVTGTAAECQTADLFQRKKGWTPLGACLPHQSATCLAAGVDSHV